MKTAPALRSFVVSAILPALAVVFLAASCRQEITVAADPVLGALLESGTVMSPQERSRLAAEASLELAVVPLSLATPEEDLRRAVEAVGSGTIVVPAAAKGVLATVLAESPDLARRGPRIVVINDEGERLPGTVSVVVERGPAFEAAGRRAAALIESFPGSLELSILMTESDRPLSDRAVDGFLSAGGSPDRLRLRLLSPDAVRDEVRQAVGDLSSSATGLVLVAAGEHTGYAMELLARDGVPVIVEGPSGAGAYGDQVVAFIEASLVDMLVPIGQGAGIAADLVEVQARLVEGQAVYNRSETEASP